MPDTKPKMKTVNPEDAPKPLSETSQKRIAALAHRQAKAGGVLMKVVSYAGSRVEGSMQKLPNAARNQIEAGARRALEHSYHAAARSREAGPLARISGDRAHKLAATLSGALGGLGGLPTALAELPVATTVIFRAVQDVAEHYGEDPSTAETRAECLRVFGSGGPGEADDGIDTAFLGARLSLTGPALSRLLNTVAPRFASVLGQKLATQTIPVIGAAAGAGTNYAFVDYYVEMAHVHFGLRQIARDNDMDLIADHFHKTLEDRQLPLNRG